MDEFELGHSLPMPANEAILHFYAGEGGLPALEGECALRIRVVPGKTLSLESVRESLEEFVKSCLQRGYGNWKSPHQTVVVSPTSLLYDLDEMVKLAKSGNLKMFSDDIPDGLTVSDLVQALGESDDLLQLIKSGQLSKMTRGSISSFMDYDGYSHEAQKILLRTWLNNSDLDHSNIKARFNPELVKEVLESQPVVAKINSLGFVRFHNGFLGKLLDMSAPLDWTKCSMAHILLSKRGPREAMLASKELRLIFGGYARTGDPLLQELCFVNRALIQRDMDVRFMTIAEDDDHELFMDMLQSLWVEITDRNLAAGLLDPEEASKYPTLEEKPLVEPIGREVTIFSM